MKRKILTILLCGVLLVGLTGCESDYSTTNDGQMEDENSTSKISIDDVSNSAVATVVSKYLQALYIDKNSEVAYSYIDFLGVLTWRNLNYNYTTHITKEQADLFMTKYKEYDNVQNENNVQKFINDKLTDEYYVNTNSELPTKNVPMIIRNTTELVTGLWKVEVYQDDSFEISSYYYLLYNNDQYKFVDLNSLYVTSLVNDMDYLNK